MFLPNFGICCPDSVIFVSSILEISSFSKVEAVLLDNEIELELESLLLLSELEPLSISLIFFFLCFCFLAFLDFVFELDLDFSGMLNTSE